MGKAASSSELRAAFEHHLKETEGHVHRLDKIFDQVSNCAYMLQKNLDKRTQQTKLTEISEKMPIPANQGQRD
jgi:ferritin-like metal-binding protein YciE